MLFIWIILSLTQSVGFLGTHFLLATNWLMAACDWPGWISWKSFGANKATEKKYSQKLGCLLGAQRYGWHSIYPLSVRAFMCSQSHRTWDNPPAGCHARRNHVPAAIDSLVIYKDTKTSTMCSVIVYFRSLKPLLINNCLSTIIIIDIFRDVHNCT